MGLKTDPGNGGISRRESALFALGVTVVHPQHGVGQIVALQDREFEQGQSRRYYEIAIPGGSTIWVPVDRVPVSLRRLARRSEIEGCRRILKAQPVPLTQDGRLRQSELVAQLQRCTISAQCEVVRDLSAFVAHKAAYGTIPAFLEAIRNVLCQEWALVEGITVPEAAAEIEALLQRPAKK